MNHNYGHRLLLTLILPLLMLSFTACAGSGDERSTSKPTTAASQGGIVETDSFIGMIFTSDQISANTYWPGNDEPWTPSEADIIAFEEQLTGYLQE